MRFSIERDILKKAIDAAQGLINKNTPTPILGHVCITASQGYVTFAATDTETFLTVKVPALDMTDGETTVNAHLLNDIARHLPNITAPVSVVTEEEDKILTIGANQAKFKLPTLPADGFPIASMRPDPAQAVSFRLAAHTLQGMFRQCRACMPADDIRYYLNGLYLVPDNEKNQLHAVATDGHRLCLVVEEIDDIPTFDGIIVPRKTVMEISRLLGRDEQDVTVVLTSTSILFEFGNGIEMCARLIDGRFPDYKPVVPAVEERPNQMLVEAKRLTEAIERVVVVSSQRVRSIELAVSADGCKLFGREDTKEGIDQIPVESFTGENVAANYNARYMSDILREISQDSVRFHWGDPSLPLLICGEDTEKIKYVMMPLRPGR